MHIFKLDIHFMDIYFHLISSKLWPSGYNGGLVIWRPSGVCVSNPTVDKIFCNVHLLPVPRSWTGSVKMKSSMKFIRGNRCIERERWFKKPRSKTFKGVRTSFNMCIYFMYIYISFYLFYRIKTIQIELWWCVHNHWISKCTVMVI